MSTAATSTDLQDALQTLLTNFVETGTERGTQVAVYLHGKKIADAWAGVACPKSGELVNADTLFPSFSTSKGVTATIIHLLVERGLLTYDTPISDVWPEFRGHGKENITVREALTHTAGLAELPAELTFGDIMDWQRACAAMERAKPQYAPGTQFAYHAKTFGWLLGETARRVDGRPFSLLVEQEMIQPLGLEGLFIGLPNPEDYLIAVLEEADPVLGTEVPLEGIEDLPAGKVPMFQQMNYGKMHAACLPSSNGLMNAGSVARFYASLLPGGVDGVEILPASRITKAMEWSTRKDPAGADTKWRIGYQYLACEGYEMFGHGGYGGSMGLACPELGFALGFTRNRLGGPANWEQACLEIIRGLQN